MESIGRSASAGVLWMTAQKWASRIGGLITIVILTRLLQPEAFGMVAAASAMLPLVYALSDGGFAAFIIQAERVDTRRLSTAFWFSLAIGAVLAAAICLVSPALANVLGIPEAVGLLQAIAASVLIISLGSVPVALMRRTMKFRSLALVELSGTSLSQIVAVLLAWHGAGAWALIAQFMTSQIVATVATTAITRWRPRLQFSFADFSEMGRFGIKVVGSSMVQVTRQWGETSILIIGLGARDMGYLTIAMRLVQTTQDMTAAALLPVSMSAFAKYRPGSAALRSAYLRAQSMLHMAVAPMMILLGVASTQLVVLLFGEDKARSAAVLPMLVVAAVVSIGYPVDQGLHWGLGRPGRWFAFSAISYTIALSVTALLVNRGMVAVAIGWAATASLDMAARWFVVAPLVGARPARLVRPFAAVLLPAAVAASSGVAVLWLLSGQTAIVTVAGAGLVLGVVYVLLVRRLLSGTFTDMVRILPERLSARLAWIVPPPRAEQPQAR